MKSLNECLEEALNQEIEEVKTPVTEAEDAEVYVVKDKDDGTIITVCDTKEDADKAAKEGTSYEVVTGKRSEYVK